MLGSLDILIERPFAFVLVTESVGSEILAKDVWFDEFRRRMEALEYQFIFLQRCGQEQAVVQDTENQGVKAVRDGREGQ